MVKAVTAEKFKTPAQMVELIIRKGTYKLPMVLKGLLHNF